MITVDFERLWTRSKDKILDIGCGAGRHTAMAAGFVNVTAIGADIHLDDVLQAREKLKFHEKFGEVRGAWGVLVSNILNLPFPDNCFDTVICSEVLEHIKDDECAIEELGRVLKPGKILAVSVPRYLPERICWMLSESYRTSAGGHIRIYRKKELIGLIESAGFKQFGEHGAHGIHSPYWWLKCLVGPDNTDNSLVKLYHRFLVWDIMKAPRITRTIDAMLSPLMGKSTVLYFRKTDTFCAASV